ncbi:hypothetical protein AB0D22_07100 [Kitasatospora sp. NPDC048538]|uniref:hypothetical protein n=1 Tax=Kitasatospora sp. NPDC048538 TaxID=3155633 RepID=UPI0033E41978
MATLSSALSDAVTGERLARNPAKPPLISRPAPAKRHLWTEEQAARFLRFTHVTDPLYADLAELMIGTGMRTGEVSGCDGTTSTCPSAPCSSAPRSPRSTTTSSCSPPP